MLLSELLDYSHTDPKDVPCMMVFVFEQYVYLDEDQPSWSRENPKIRIVSSSSPDNQ